MDALIFSRYAILILTIGVLLLPKRYAFISLIMLGLFDASGPAFYSASQVGILNAIKVLGASLILMVRLKFQPLNTIIRERTWRVPIYLFLIFVIYAGIAILWTNWKLNAIKMLGYLIGYILWFALLCYGWMRGFINRRSILFIYISSIFLGILQSYVLTPVFGVYQFEMQRFTAFVSPQYFAGFMVMITAILIFSYRKLLYSIIFISVTLFIVVMSGSRYSFINLFFVLFVFMIYNLRKSRTRLVFLILVCIFTSVIGIGTLLESIGYNILPVERMMQTRIGELRYLVSNPEAIGTLSWRLAIYRSTISEILSSKLHYLFLGHGTSSSAEIALMINPHYIPESIDANRVIHNELLRSMYEWGIVGFSILLILIVFLTYSTIKFALVGAKFQGYIALSVLPLIVSSILIENVLASAGSAWGVGVALILGGAWMETRYQRLLRQVKQAWEPKTYVLPCGGT